jgi:hypothetical protein
VDCCVGQRPAEGFACGIELMRDRWELAIRQISAPVLRRRVMFEGGLHAEGETGSSLAMEALKGKMLSFGIRICKITETEKVEIEYIERRYAVKNQSTVIEGD